MSVDDATDERFVGFDAGRQFAAHEVKANRLDGRGEQNGQGVIQAFVRCGDEDLRAARNCTKCFVRFLCGGENGRAWHVDRLADQSRLFELHPLGPGRGQCGEQFGVHRQQVVEAVEGLVALGGRLARLR